MFRPKTIFVRHFTPAGKSMLGLKSLFTLPTLHTPNQWKYFDLNDKPRNNPAGDIKQANIRQRNLQKELGNHKRITKTQSDHLYKVDYVALNEGLNTGLAEIWGARTYQEDKAIADPIFDFEKVPEDKREEVLKKYVSNLQGLLKENEISGGSTLNTTIICGNKIYNANVGDTDSHLAILHTDGQVTLKRLNESHHHPKNAGEKERLQEGNFWKYVHKKRLCNVETRHSYALSRAMGDNQMEKYGLIHTPDISTSEVKLQGGEKAFVITKCDGLAKLKTDEIKQIIKENSNEPPHTIAKALVTSADKKGSRDNMTCVVMRVIPDSQQTRYQAMFDGHTNNDVSDFLFENSTKVLNETIQTSLKPTDLPRLN